MSSNILYGGLFIFILQLSEFGPVVLAFRVSIHAFLFPKFCKLSKSFQAWRLFREDRPLELIDNSFNYSCNPTEVLRSIQVGLLCVQKSSEHRPTMCNVVLMLSSETALPQPKEPSFLNERHVSRVDSSRRKQEGRSNNGLTISSQEAR